MPINLWDNFEIERMYTSGCVCMIIIGERAFRCDAIYRRVYTGNGIGVGGTILYGITPPPLTFTTIDLLHIVPVVVNGIDVKLTITTLHLLPYCLIALFSSKKDGYVSKLSKTTLAPSLAGCVDFFTAEIVSCNYALGTCATLCTYIQFELASWYHCYVNRYSTTMCG